MSRRGALLWGLLLSLAAVLAIAPAAHANSRTLTIGFSDPLLASTSAGPWLNVARSEGTQLERFDAYWWQIEIRQPTAGSDPTNPANPAYDWRNTDAVIRQLTAYGFNVVFQPTFAPPWDQGANPAHGVTGGTWYPNATQYGHFAAAAARRYSGSYPDPLHPGKALPRVRYWQPWNEPNLASYITPQWGCQNGTGPKCTGGKFVPLSPGIYRGLLNSFYAGVKSVNPSNYVVMAGLAPYGNAPPLGRMRPMVFHRALFCLSTALRALPCPTASHLDALDAHPYEENNPPTKPARNRDDVTVPDLHKIGAAARAGVRTGHILPRNSKALWVTELAWESTPPGTNAFRVSLANQARYLSQADQILWRQGVNTVLWYRLPDAPPSQGDRIGTFAASGLFFYNGPPKPSAAAFKFPFVASRLDKGHVRAWGRAPASGPVDIARRTSSGKWVGLARVNVTRAQVFQKTIALRGGAVLRARIGKLVSPSWTVGG